MFKLFTRKKELQRKQTVIDSLNAQISKLRVEIVDNRDAHDKAIEALNMECEDLTKEVKEKDALISKQEETIGRLIKENHLLIKTNANLSSKLNIKRGADGRFVSTKKDHE